MAEQWRMIRVPADLAERLDRLARSFEAAHATGRLRLPDAYCESVPLHYAIARAVDRLEDHRRRGNRKGRGRVYIIDGGESDE